MVWICRNLCRMLAGSPPGSPGIVTANDEFTQSFQLGTTSTAQQASMSSPLSDGYIETLSENGQSPQTLVNKRHSQGEYQAPVDDGVWDVSVCHALWRVSSHWMRIAWNRTGFHFFMWDNLESKISRKEWRFFHTLGFGNAPEVKFISVVVVVQPWLYSVLSKQNEGKCHHLWGRINSHPAKYNRRATLGRDGCGSGRNRDFQRFVWPKANLNGTVASCMWVCCRTDV